MNKSDEKRIGEIHKMINHIKGAKDVSLHWKKEMIRKYKKEKADIINAKPEQIELGEWLYRGCFIQHSEHPRLMGKYEVFKNNKTQAHVDRCHTFTEAKKLCIENECAEHYLKF